MRAEAGELGTWAPGVVLDALQCRRPAYPAPPGSCLAIDASGDGEWDMSKTILVVEDDSDMRALINRHLLNAGYAVRAVANGLEAAAACLSITPDLIVSDVHMPRMNGFDMIEILKSEPMLRDVPVIFLSADSEGVERGNSLGAVAYLTKPIRMDHLVDSVAEHLQEKG